jgi:hypothetical protein
MGANISLCPGSSFTCKCLPCRRKRATTSPSQLPSISPANKNFHIVKIDKTTKTFTLGPGDVTSTDVFLVDRSVTFIAASGNRFEAEWGIPSSCLLGKQPGDPSLPFSGYPGLVEFYNQIYAETLSGRMLSFYTGWNDFYYEINTFPQTDPFDNKRIWGAMLTATWRSAPPIDIQSLEVTRVQKLRHHRHTKVMTIEDKGHNSNDDDSDGDGDDDDNDDDDGAGVVNRQPWRPLLRRGRSPAP